MKKFLISATLFIALFILSFSLVSATSTVLDDVSTGSLATWEQYTSPYNPISTYTEITSPYDGSTALKTSVTGDTLMYCDTKYISKTFDVGSSNTDTSDLHAYLEFWYDGTYYNFPFIQVVLLDDNDQSVGSHVWYGKGVVGGLYQSYIAADPGSYSEFPSDKGYFDMDMSAFGSNIAYSKIKVYMLDYTCIGNNYIVMDHLVFDNNTTEVPEFGLIAGVVALIGALAIFIFRRK